MPNRSSSELPYSTAAKRVAAICGGPAEVARWIGVDKSTVTRWGRRAGGRSTGSNGYIPSGYQHLIIIAARKRNIHLDFADFFDLDAFEDKAA